MRILYVSDNSSEHNRRFLTKLAAAGNAVFFLDICSKRVPPEWLPSGVFRVAHNTVFSGSPHPEAVRSFLPEFRRILADIRPDVLHAGPIPTCGFLSGLSAFHPYVAMSWGSDLLVDAKRGTEWTSATLLALQNADGFVCDCDTVKTAALEYANFWQWQMAQFPWGVTAGVFSPAGDLPAVAELPFGAETIRLICTRSWEPLYQIDLLLEAFRLARKCEYLLRLILLGDGSERERIREFIARNSLSDVVLTPGRIAPSELPRWFHAANAYVSCAESDGTSVSLLEAMATGLPVIVTDLPANREWIKEDENGWLATGVEGFSQALLRSSRLTQAQRETISVKNREIVAARANWDLNFPRLLVLYDRLVNAGEAVPA